MEIALRFMQFWPMSQRNQASHFTTLYIFSILFLLFDNASAVDLKASVPAKFSSPEINPKENVLVHEATKVVSKDDIPVDEGSPVRDKFLIHEGAIINLSCSSPVP